MKASVLIATWNKIDLLSNTLYSIARQKTSFPFEVCIVDDCSDVDPEPIIRKFLPDAKYKRLDNHVGFMLSHGKCLDLVADDVDTIVLQPDDVIHTQDDILEKLCHTVDHKTIALAEVVSVDVKTDVFKNFNYEIKEIMKEWDFHKSQREPFKKGNQTLLTTAICSGKSRKSWLFYLGAIKRKDLEILGYRTINCDAVINYKMLEQKFKANIMGNLKGIHQRHPKMVYPCPIVESCGLRKRCGR